MSLTEPTKATMGSAADNQLRSRLARELVVSLMLGRRAPVTLLLLGIMGGMFVLSVLLGGSTDLAVLTVLGAKVQGRVLHHGEWWRLAASVFVHAGIVHLLVNGYALFVIGRLVENGFGRDRYLVLFVFAGVAGSLASLLATPHPSVGASGAVFGLLGASLVGGFKHRRVLPKALRGRLAAALIPWLALALAYGFVVEQVDNAAHLGGLAAGVVFGAVAGTPLSGQEEVGRGSMGLWGALALAMGVLLYGFLGSFASIIRAVQ